MPDWMYSWPSGLMTNRPSKPIEPALYVLDRDADAAHLRCRRACRCCALRSSHLNSSAPLSSASLTNALVDVLPLAASVRRWAERRLALRRVDAADRHLIDPELARRLRDDRLHEHVRLHAARLTLRRSRRRVRQHRDAAPAHRLRLIHQRRDRRRCCCSRPGARTGRCR